jgi:hypothetical protein
MNKYRNIKTVVNNITFDSKKEAARYSELLLLEKAKELSNLQLQKPFEICPKKNGNKRARYYVADFVYYDRFSRTWVIEDVKSPITRKNPVYSLKKALILANYPEYEFRES